MSSLFAAVEPFASPHLDWHAFAPETVLVVTFALVILVDLFTAHHNKWLTSVIASFGFLVALVPVVSLAVDGGERAMFGGAYVVDDFSLVMKAVFLIAGYITVLLSTHYIAEGDYWEGEYYTLLVASVLGMTLMASARDLITIFVALELLSIPAYLLAGWRKRSLTGNEAGVKYYLMGVFASAVMLYGMSLIFGVTNATVLSDIGEALNGPVGDSPVVALGIVFVLIGFGFKVSAVPFHNWAPDTYEGAPTPITAFLSVASKAAGFVALLELIFVAFYGRDEIYAPLMFVLATATMFVGNLIALRQTNVVRLFAYSSVAQAGFILAPLAVAGHSHSVSSDAIEAVVSYLIVYTVMNLGAFGVIIAVSRRTGSGEISSWNGLFAYSPVLAVSMSAFLFALAGIPPLGGWFAKFQVFRTVVAAGTPAGYVMGVIVGVNSVIALYYYANIAKTMFFEAPADADDRSIKVPGALVLAVGVTVVATLVLGCFPGIITHFSASASDLLAAGK